MKRTNPRTQITQASLSQQHPIQTTPRYYVNRPATARLITFIIYPLSNPMPQVVSTTQPYIQGNIC